MPTSLCSMAMPPPPLARPSRSRTRSRSHRQAAISHRCCTAIMIPCFTINTIHSYSSSTTSITTNTSIASSHTKLHRRCLHHHLHHPYQHHLRKSKSHLRNATPCVRVDRCCFPSPTTRTMTPAPARLTHRTTTPTKIPWHLELVLRCAPSYPHPASCKGRQHLLHMALLVSKLVLVLALVLALVLVLVLVLALALAIINTTTALELATHPVVQWHQDDTYQSSIDRCSTMRAPSPKSHHTITINTTNMTTRARCTLDGVYQ